MSKEGRRECYEQFLKNPNKKNECYKIYAAEFESEFKKKEIKDGNKK